MMGDERNYSERKAKRKAKSHLSNWKAKSHLSNWKAKSLIAKSHLSNWKAKSHLSKGKAKSQRSEVDKGGKGKAKSGEVDKGKGKVVDNNAQEEDDHFVTLVAEAVSDPNGRAIVRLSEMLGYVTMMIADKVNERQKLTFRRLALSVPQLQATGPRHGTDEEEIAEYLLSLPEEQRQEAFRTFRRVIVTRLEEHLQNDLRRTFEVLLRAFTYDSSPSQGGGSSSSS